jgi:hypothetical protein
MLHAAQCALPPEHRVAARKLLDRGDEEWIVEGPMMPLVQAGAQPPVVMLIFTIGHIEYRDFTLTAHWGHDDALRYWKVGQWDTQAEYIAWRDA